MLDVSSAINLLRVYNIRVEELFLAQILFLATQEENDKQPLYEYISLSNRGDIREMLLTLKEVGILSSRYKIPNKGEPLVLENIVFSKNFTKLYLTHSGELGEDLWNYYPNMLHINGAAYPAKNIAKKYNSIEEFFHAYGKAIRFNPETHKKIVEIIKWADENHLIKENLANFVINRQWTMLETIKNSGYDGKTLDIEESL